MPPTVATSATPSSACSSYFRNQSWIERSCGEVVPAGAVGERVLVDPADAGGIRPERRPHALGQPGRGLAQVLEHARARPVRIGAVFEQHVDERVAVERVAAHGRRARHRQQRRGERIGDLVLDQPWRLPGIRRAHDDLHVREVGQRVDRRAQVGIHADRGQHRRQQQHHRPVLERGPDDRVDHCAASPSRSEARAQVRLGIEQELARDHHLLALREAFADHDAITALGARGHAPGREATIAERDHDAVLAAAADQRAARDHHRRCARPRPPA